MIVTTTPSVEGRRITEYKGVVFGEVIAGVNFVKDFVAGLSNFFGGRSGTYEEELINARQQALDEMEQRAAQLGADAVVGVDHQIAGGQIRVGLEFLAVGVLFQLPLFVATKHSFRFQQLIFQQPSSIVLLSTQLLLLTKLAHHLLIAVCLQ